MASESQYVTAFVFFSEDRSDVGSGLSLIPALVSIWAKIRTHHEILILYIETLVQGTNNGSVKNDDDYSRVVNLTSFVASQLLYWDVYMVASEIQTSHNAFF